MLFTLLFYALSASADARSCEQPKTYKDFYYCSLAKHPEFKISELKVKESQAVLDAASQWQNPELEIKSVAGEVAGEKVGATELSLAIPLSQLWTRGAQKEIGQAEKNLADLEAQETLLIVKKQLIRDLFRLRQLNEELDLSNEALSAFEKVRGQFRGRLARGPEQEITLNLVELATSDYELKRNHLAVEKAELLARLKGLWGSNFEIRKELLPPPKEKWPEVSGIKEMNSSFESRKLSAQASKAMAESKLAARESWPALSAGPTIERNTEGPNQYMNYGFNLTMTVPIFSLNGGNRKLTEVKAEQARLMSEYVNRKALLERSIVIQRYQSAVESLKKSDLRDEVRKKHQRIDSLFRQGLAPGNLIIEAHRQIIEYTASQHEHEISAIEAYLEMKAMAGDNNIEELIL